MAGAVAVFFQALPAALLAALAGLALLGTIMGGMATAMANPARREAALITLLATASGFSFWGIGSAFWAWWRACWHTPYLRRGDPPPKRLRASSRRATADRQSRLRVAPIVAWRVCAFRRGVSGQADTGVSGCTFMMRQGTCTKFEIQAAASSPSSTTSMTCSPTRML